MGVDNCKFVIYLENTKADEYFLAVCGRWELGLFGQYWKEKYVFWTILNSVDEIKSYINCPGWLWRPRVLHAILSLRQKSQSKSQFIPAIRISTTNKNFYHLYEFLPPKRYFFLFFRHLWTTVLLEISFNQLMTR